MFSCEFWEISLFTEHLWATASTHIKAGHKIRKWNLDSHKITACDGFVGLEFEYQKNYSS